ncbi:mitochondrial proton/calcium exchanger protein-like protein isoform X1 [Tanacetum coccineum]
MTRIKPALCPRGNAVGGVMIPPCERLQRFCEVEEDGWGRNKVAAFKLLEEIPEQMSEGEEEVEECCCCFECGGGGGGGDKVVDYGGDEAVEADVEGVRWAVDVGIWVMCLGVGVGYLVSKASSKSLRRREIIWHNGTSRARSTETSDGLAAIQAQLNNLGREIKKVNEKVYAAQVGCEQCKGPHYTKDFPLKEEEEQCKPFVSRTKAIYGTLSKFLSKSAKRHEENSDLIKQFRASTDVAIRNQGASIKTLEVQIGKISKVLQERGFGSLPSSTEANPRDHVKAISSTDEVDLKPIRRMGSPQYAVSAPRNRRLMFELRQMTIPFPSRLNDYYCDEEKGSYGPQFLKANLLEASHINNFIPRKEKDLRSFTLPCYINNVCFDNALANLGASVSVMPLSTYLNLGLGELAHTKLTVELTDRTLKYPKGITKNMLVGIGKFFFPVDFIILDMPEDIKVPLILRRLFLSTAHAKIDVFKTKITLRVGDEKIIFKSVKPARSLIKRVYMLSLRERMELDLEARLMGETLVLNKSLDLLNGDYIELNDLNEPLELRRD